MIVTETKFTLEEIESHCRIRKKPVNSSIVRVYYTIHIYNFPTPALGTLPDAQTDHLHTENRHKMNTWTFDHHDSKLSAYIQYIRYLYTSFKINYCRKYQNSLKTILEAGTHTHE